MTERREGELRTDRTMERKRQVATGAVQPGGAEGKAKGRGGPQMQGKPGSLGLAPSPLTKTWDRSGHAKLWAAQEPARSQPVCAGVGAQKTQDSPGGQVPVAQPDQRRPTPPSLRPTRNSIFQKVKSKCPHGPPGCPQMLILRA